ncbi:hypothetical protein MNBD_GAMMA26-227 [hydrothermal vent metagenome]|uniref:CheW-like domain-containing protein n=1 Tax=hydrothermal vent metagenome TaxID=652676 RepID=A0A3B1ARU3_9ZZZZ
MTQANEIRAVLIPINSGLLLLPNASVAEIVGYLEPEGQVNSPDWLLGMVSWRGQEVPLVCFDSLIGKPPEKRGVRARIAICNAIGKNPPRPYIAMLAQSIPRLARVTEEVIEADPEPQELGEAVIEQVLVKGENAWIPDFDKVEPLVEMALSQTDG